MANHSSKSWLSATGLIEQECARIYEICGHGKTFFDRLNADTFAKLLKKFRDPEKIFGPQPACSSLTVLDLIQLEEVTPERALAWLIAPYLYLIEVRHETFRTKLFNYIFSPKNKRSKPGSVDAVNKPLNLIGAFRIDDADAYSSRKNVTISKTEVSCIGAIQYYLKESIRVADAEDGRNARSLKDFELDSLTCALLHELSPIEPLKSLDSGLLDKRLRRRGGDYETTPSELRAKFETKYVTPSELGQLLASDAKRILNGDCSPIFNVVRRRIFSAFASAPVASFF